MKIGYIGMGIMGAAMAGNLRRAGFDLSVWNRTAGKCEPLASAGARVAASAQELARTSDVVCINVTDTPDVEHVLFGPAGVAESARAGLIVIDHSTIRADRTREFAGRLKSIGVTLLDAPVSGGDVGARNATLSIMVGGEEAAYEKCLPIFRAMGKNISRVGDSGAGQTCKACNQICVLVTLAGVCEAMRFAEASGLDPARMIEIVAGGAGGSWQLSNLGPKILAGDFKPAFMIDLAMKDLRIVAYSAETMQLNLAAVRQAQAYLAEVQKKLGGHLATQAMIHAIR